MVKYTTAFLYSMIWSNLRQLHNIIKYKNHAASKKRGYRKSALPW